MNQRPPGGVSGRMPVPSAFITSSWVLSGKSRSNTICDPSGDQEPWTASLSERLVSCRTPLPSGCTVKSWMWSPTVAW